MFSKLISINHKKDIKNYNTYSSLAKNLALKKYGQVNLFKTRVPMDGLQSIIEKYSPQDYFYRINHT